MSISLADTVSELQHDDLTLPAALLRALDDPEEDRCARAIGWMGVLGLTEPEAVAPIVEAILGRLFDPSVPLSRRRALAPALAALPATTTARVSWHLSSDDAHARELAARALAAPRHMAAVPALLQRLGDGHESVDVRMAAARALGAIGDHSAADDLLAVLGDPDPALRKAALEAFSHLYAHWGGDAVHARVLTRIATDDDAGVRAAALTALLVCGGQAARATARRAVKDRDPSVRAAALVVLARHGTPPDASLAKKHVDDAEACVRRAAKAAVAALQV